MLNCFIKVRKLLKQEIQKFWFKHTIKSEYILDKTDIDGLFSTLSNGAEEKHVMYWKIKITIYD